MQGIYCIEHLSSNRKYFGSSMNVYKRLSGHKKELQKQIHHNIQLQRAVNKYGIEQFSFYLVEETYFLNRQELLRYEQTFLDKNCGGYNMAPANGGDILSSHPDKNIIIEKIRQTTMLQNSNLTANERKEKFGHPGEKNGMYGKTHTKEVKEKLRKIHTGNSYAKGSIRSIEQRKKLSESKKGTMSGEQNPFYRKRHTEKTKSILREKMSGNNSWIKNIDPSLLPYTKKYIIQYPDGSTKEVRGLKAIAEEFDVSIENVHATIKRIAKGKIPQRGAFANLIIKEI